MAAVPYTALANQRQLKDSPLGFVAAGASNPYLDATMIRASRNVEARCARRFTPFVGLVQTERAEGVDPAPGFTSGQRLPLPAALAVAQRQAYGGASDGVTGVWLDEYAPLWPEMWTYSNVSVALHFSPGGQQNLASGWDGPDPDSGYLRLPAGSPCPVGTTVKVTYSGGYTGGVPDDLQEACLLSAAKLLIVHIEPEARNGLTTATLDAEIDSLLAPYARA